MPSLWLSLDRPAFSDDLDGGLLLDSVDDSTAQNGYIGVEEAVYREELHAALERELCTLPTIDASLIRKRYWGGETLTSIAADAGFSVNRASQIHRDAIRKLRRPQHERALRQYIEESTDYYKPCGAAKFRRTGVSPVEDAVLRREDAEERFIRRQMGNGLE